jgi:hypothetical protein
MICNKCHKEKEQKYFPKRKDTKDGFRKECKECFNKEHRRWWKQTAPIRLEYAKKYYSQNRDKIISQKVSGNLKYRRLARIDCIIHYSKGKKECECCGEKNMEFLTIDHINGNGNKHRKEIKEYIPLFLKKKRFPKGYRILCYNCNCSLGFYKYCPHQEVKNANRTTP